MGLSDNLPLQADTPVKAESGCTHGGAPSLPSPLAEVHGPGGSAHSTWDLPRRLVPGPPGAPRVCRCSSLLHTVCGTCVHHALPYGGITSGSLWCLLARAMGTLVTLFCLGPSDKKSLRVFRTDATTSGLTTQCTSVTT